VRSLLLHIGPHKTGTTAVQGAFHVSRDRLAAHGIHYAGETRQRFRAALAAVGSPGPKGQPPPDRASWDALITEITTADEDCIVLSSEAFAGADDATARRIVGELGDRPVHVVVTLRPLAKIAPSQWQQMVQNGLRAPYDRWLAKVFNDADDRSVSDTFWRRHDHAGLIARWIPVVGAENLTVIAVDDSDRGGVLRSFEQLLGLPTGVLESPVELTNRSLTWGEVELIRAINRAAAKEEWPERYFGKVLHAGVIDAMKKERKPAAKERKISTPRWALERAARIGVETVEMVTSSGVNVIGDLSILTTMPTDPTLVRENDEPQPREVPIRAAMLAVLGAVRGLDSYWAPKAVTSAAAAKRGGTTMPERIRKKADRLRRRAGS